MEDRTFELERVFGANNVRPSTMRPQYFLGDCIASADEPDKHLIVYTVGHCACLERSYFVGNGRWLCGGSLASSQVREQGETAG